MLEKILLNFSEDELLSFLNRASIDFAMKITQQKDEIEGLNKNQLTTIIANSKQVDFVFSEKLRSLLIDRSTPDLFILLFPEFELLSKEIKPKHYEAAIEWASISPFEFQ